MTAVVDGTDTTTRTQKTSAPTKRMYATMFWKRDLLEGRGEETRVVWPVNDKLIREIAFACKCSADKIKTKFMSTGSVESAHRLWVLGIWDHPNKG